MAHKVLPGACRPRAGRTSRSPPAKLPGDGVDGTVVQTAKAPVQLEPSPAVQQ